MHIGIEEFMILVWVVEIKLPFQVLLYHFFTVSS